LTLELVDSHCISGPPSKVLSTLKRKISQLKKNRTRFKIGSTGDPSYRINGYDDNLYKQMYVVYRTSSLDNMVEIEKELIDFFYNCRENKNLNGGSAGPAPTQDNSFYIYVVVGRKKKLSAQY